MFKTALTALAVGLVGVLANCGGPEGGGAERASAVRRDALAEIGPNPCVDACAELFGLDCTRAVCKGICTGDPDDCNDIPCHEGEVDCYGNCVSYADAESYGC